MNGHEQELLTELANRARQQAAIAELGLVALAGKSSGALFDEATARVASVLGADFATFAETTAGGDLVIVSGVGYTEGTIGTRIPGARGSLGGFVLLRSEPVVVEDWATETRVEKTPILEAHGVTSSVCVIVGTPSDPIGILAVHTRAVHRFSRDDVNFLQSIANVLAGAVSRSRTERSLRASQERWHLLADAVPLMIWTALPSGELDYLNRRWFEYAGHGLEEGVRTAWAKVVHPEDLARGIAAGAWARSLESGEPYEIQLRLKRAKDSQFRWHLVRAVPVRDAAGKIFKWFGSNTDVDDQRRALEEQKRAEEALRESRRQLERALAVGRIASWSAELPPGSTERVWSPEMYRIFGLPEGQRMDLASFTALVHPEDRGRVLEAMRAAAADRTDYAMDYRIVRPDGRTVWIRSKAEVVADDSGKQRLIGVSQDITEAHDKDEALRQATKMEAVGRLAGGVAHDFNNMLTAINGYAELCLRSVNPRDPLHEHLREILNAGTRAGALTQQLLAFSRKQVLQPRVLDLNAVVAGTERILSRVVGEDVEIETRLAPDLARVLADANQLEQVIMNLVVNARDAMPGGGTVTIETGQVVPGGLGPHVFLAVSDTGGGMDSETLSHLFEPFFTTRKGSGTGLGLSTVYGIVKQSGGTIAVESQLGRGSRFTIQFPAVREPVSDAPSVPAAPAPARGRETILLVEDEDLVRHLAARVLAGLGYTVLEASSGSEALLLSEAHRETIDLLLTDVVMPRMSGRQLAERLVVSRPGIKVLFMSGYTDDALGHHGVLAAETEFLQKPFATSALEAKVRAVLGKKRA